MLKCNFFAIVFSISGDKAVNTFLSDKSGYDMPVWYTFQLLTIVVLENKICTVVM